MPEIQIIPETTLELTYREHSNRWEAAQRSSTYAELVSMLNPTEGMEIPAVVEFNGANYNTTALFMYEESQDESVFFIGNRSIFRGVYDNTGEPFCVVVSNRYLIFYARGNSGWDDDTGSYTFKVALMVEPSEEPETEVSTGRKYLLHSMFSLVIAKALLKEWKE